MRYWCFSLHRNFTLWFPINVNEANIHRKIFGLFFCLPLNTTYLCCLRKFSMLSSGKEFHLWNRQSSTCLKTFYFHIEPSFKRSFYALSEEVFIKTHKQTLNGRYYAIIYVSFCTKYCMCGISCYIYVILDAEFMCLLSLFIHSIRAF